MLLVGFGGKRPDRKRFKPSFPRKPNYESVFRKFAGSVNAKTVLKKIRQAETVLSKLDKRDKHPSSPEYKKELRRLYTQKYSNIIRYWADFRDFARATNAESSVIQGIEKILAKVKRDWNTVQEFL